MALLDAEVPVEGREIVPDDELCVAGGHAALLAAAAGVLLGRHVHRPLGRAQLIEVVRRRPLLRSAAARAAPGVQAAAEPLFGLGHGRDGRELVHQLVAAERALDDEGGAARLGAAVLALQHLHLLLQQVRRQLVPGRGREQKC